MRLRNVVATTLMASLVAGGTLVMTTGAQPDDRPGRDDRPARMDDDRRSGDWGRWMDRDKDWGPRSRDSRGRRGPSHEGFAGNFKGECPMFGAVGMGGPGAPGAPHGKRALFPFWENEKIASQLDLSDDQIAALEESLEITRNELDQSDGSFGEFGKKIKNELDKNNPDLDTVYQLSDEATEEANEKAKTILGHVVTVKNVLTEEQGENLHAVLREGMHKRFEEMRGVHQEVRETIRSGGSIEDVKGLLEKHDVPDEFRKPALERAKKGIEWHQEMKDGKTDGYKKWNGDKRNDLSNRERLLNRWDGDRERRSRR